MIADVDWIPDEDGELLSVRSCLAGLLSDETIELYRHSDMGVPEGVARTEPAYEYIKPAAIGWMEVDELDENEIRRVTTATTTEVRHCGVIGNAVDIARLDDRDTGAYSHLDRQSAAAARERDAIAAGAASAVGADLFISTRPYLHATTFNGVAGDVAVMTPEQALPLVGLYLRSQGRFLDGARRTAPRLAP